MKISLQMYLWTGKNGLNVGSNLHLNPNPGFIGTFFDIAREGVSYTLAH